MSGPIALLVAVLVFGLGGMKLWQYILEKNG